MVLVGVFVMGEVVFCVGVCVVVLLLVWLIWFFKRLKVIVSLMCGLMVSVCLYVVLMEVSCELMRL